MRGEKVVQFLIFLGRAAISKVVATASEHDAQDECTPEVLVAIAGRRREHEPRGGGTDQIRAQCTGIRSEGASRDRLRGHDVEGGTTQLGC